VQLVQLGLGEPFAEALSAFGPASLADREKEGLLEAVEDHYGSGATVFMVQS
jgi:hypothetical protein